MYSLDIKEYAKQLYLQVNAKGNRKYTIYSIAKKIYEKFGEKVHPNTVKKWANNERWYGMLKGAMIASVYQSPKKQEEEKEEVDESPEERIATILAKARRQAMLNQLQVSQKMKEAIKIISIDSPRFARLMEVASKVNKTLYEMLEDVEEKQDTEKPVIIINEIHTDNIKNNNPA